MLVLFRRIVRNCIYYLILWHQYQSILYVSTRNKIFKVMVLPFVEPYLWFYAGSATSQTSFVWELHVLVSWPTPHWMFHSLAPSLILLPFPPTTLCSLCWWIWKCVGLSVDCCVEGLYSTSWWFLIEFLRCFHWACTVVYVLYSWCCRQALGVPQYRGGYCATLRCAFTVVYVL